MMNTMNTTGMDTAFGFTFLWLIHVLAVVIFFSGLIVLIAWAIKTLPAAQLKNWALGLLVVGAVLCLLTVASLGRPWLDGAGGMMQGARMMHGMMDDDDKEEMMGEMMGRGMMNDDHMNMSMNGMNEALEGRTGDAFDEEFLRMMIPHHQGAIDMAVAAKASAKHQEIKDMADAIIDAQQREIDMMEDWLDDWGYND